MSTSTDRLEDTEGFELKVYNKKLTKVNDVGCKLRKNHRLCQLASLYRKKGIKR
jgi:hypothetical protein